VKFFYNRELGQLVTFAGGNTVLTAGPSFKRRDTTIAELAIYASDTPGTNAIQLTSATLQLGMKEENSYGNSPLIVNAPTWTWDAAALVYRADVPLNSYQMTRLFIQASALNIQSGTSYTLAITDATKLITLGNASAITLTIPTNASVAIPINSVIYLLRSAAGLPTLSYAGVTVTFEDDLVAAMPPNTVYRLTKTGTDTWTVDSPPEQSSITLDLEITGLDGDSTQTLKSTIYNDVIRGDETSPTNSQSPDNYYTKEQGDARYLQSVADGSVTTAKLASASVTTAKIADANVTAVKLSSDSVTTAKITDAHVTTAKIADANVTSVKLSSDSVTTAKLADGAVTAAKLESVSGLTAGTVLVKSVTVDAKGRITSYKPKYRASITANATISSSTLDLDVTTLTIPAGTLEVGDVIEFELFGTSNNSTTASNFLTWVKINGTKTTAVTHAMGTVAASAVAWHTRGMIRVDSLTSTNNLTISFDTQWKLTQGISPVSLATVNLNTTALVIIPGLNFSVASGTAATVYQGAVCMQ
jgi:hypothetical protein